MISIKTLGNHFFSLLDKYYSNHNETYLSTETLIVNIQIILNVNGYMAERFRMALIDTDYVLVSMIFL